MPRRKKGSTSAHFDGSNEGESGAARFPTQFRYPEFDVPPRALVTSYGLPRYQSKIPSDEVKVRIISLRSKLSKAERKKKRVLQQEAKIRHLRFSLAKKKRTQTPLVSVVATDAGLAWLEKSFDNRLYLSPLSKKTSPRRLQDRLSAKSKKLDYQKHVAASLLKNRDHRKWNAAIKLQSFWRQSKAMNWLSTLAKLRRRHVAAVRIQGMHRKRVARKERAKRAELKKKQLAATRIQSLQRGAASRAERTENIEAKRALADKIAKLEEVKRVEDERLASMSKAETRRMGVAQRLVRMLNKNVQEWRQRDEELLPDEKLKQREVNRLAKIVAKAEAKYQEKERVANKAKAEADEMRAKQLAEEAGQSVKHAIISKF